MAIEPTKKDLDPSHPLFVAMSTRNVFQRVFREKAKKDGGGKKHAKRARTTNKETGAGNATLPLTLFGATPTARPISWIEILCQRSDTKQEHQIKKKPDVKPKIHWIHVDPRYELVNQPDLVEAVVYAERQGIPFKQVKKKVPIPYALAAEHISVSGNLRTRLTDVTPRYASSWTESLKTRGILRGKQKKVKESERVDKWWTETLKCVNSGERSRMEKLSSKGKSLTDAIVLDDSSADGEKPAADTHIEEVDDHEEEELKASTKDEPLPTSKTAFKSHPVYVLPSGLNQNEVLVPDAKKRICGVFKGELVFRRCDVQCALPAKRWLYKGRKVKGRELSKPIRRVNARKQSTKGFKALKSYGIGDGNDGSEEARAKQLAAASKPLDDDDKEDLYAPWQTDPWSPTPVGPNDPIPVNEYNNIELELLNPGLVHIVEHRIAVVAKQLGMYVHNSIQKALFIYYVVV
jgi:xeroderma pigmentosum group C-complementing protein